MKVSTERNERRLSSVKYYVRISRGRMVYSPGPSVVVLYARGVRDATTVRTQARTSVSQRPTFPYSDRKIENPPPTWSSRDRVPPPPPPTVFTTLAKVSLYYSTRARKAFFCVRRRCRSTAANENQLSNACLPICVVPNNRRDIVRTWWPTRCFARTNAGFLFRTITSSRPVTFVNSFPHRIYLISIVR